MRDWPKAIVVAIQLGLGTALGFNGAQAQAPTTTIRNIALKSGETQDLGPVYSVRNCRSITIAKPEAEILEGPQDLAVTIKEGDVVPRNEGCRNKVPGGTLEITAPKEIDEPSFTRLTIRVKYKTREGDRQATVIYNLSLVP
jgi:hypothetical protein